MDVLSSMLIDGFKSLISKAGSYAFSKIIKNEKEVVYSIKTNKKKSQIKRHLIYLNNFAREITFYDLMRAKKLSRCYIDLVFYIGIRERERCISQEELDDKVISLKENAVIVGDPGAGKTTFLKKVIQNILQCEETIKNMKPILIRLRAFKANETLTSAILSILGLYLNFSEDMPKFKKEDIEKQFLNYILSKLSLLILIDGLDEIPLSKQHKVIDDLEYFVLSQNSSKFVLTCRTANFVYDIGNCTIYEIAPLSEIQIRNFAIKWIGSEKTDDFLEQINSTPYKGAEVRPITIAHLCALYERRGKIPEKPKSIYRKIVKLLLEEWDEQRRIRRASKYANFEVDRKQDFLEVFAWEMLKEHGKSVFSHQKMVSVYHKINKKFSLPEAEGEKVIREIESHTGLIIKSSYERYEFTHKSIHEFFAASYINKLPKLPSSSIIVRFPEEFGLAVGLSSEPNEYFLNIIKSLILTPVKTLKQFTLPFLRRIKIENVDFFKSSELGAGLCFLYSSNLYFDTELASGEEKVKVEMIFNELIKWSVMKASLKLFLSKCIYKRGLYGLIKLSSDKKEWNFLKKEFSNEMFIPTALFVDALFLDQLGITYTVQDK